MDSTQKTGPWRVIVRWRGAKSSTTFGCEADARAYVAAMRKRGVRNVYATPV